MAKTGWVWDGTQFVALTAPVGAFPNAVGNYDSVAPSNPRTGQIWNDTSTNTLRVWTGSTWLSYAPTSLPTLTNPTISSATFSGTASGTLDLTNGNFIPPVQTSNRNKLINGKFDIWQRGTITTHSSSATVYSADRWETYRDGYAAGLTVSRQSGIGVAQYCARIQRDSGNTSTAGGNFYQPLESVDSYPFSQSNVVWSFWARAGANLSGSVTAAIRTGTATNGNFRNGSFPTTVGSSILSLTTNWQKFIITGTVAANATQIGVGFYIAFSGTAGAADYFEVTQAQLEFGTAPTPFETKRYAQELTDCFRYYERFGGTGIGDLPTSLAQTDVANRPEVFLDYSIKRIAPVITVINPTNFTFYFLNKAGTVAATAFAGTLVRTSPQRSNLFFNVASGVAQYDMCLIINSSNGIIEVNAEL